MSPQRRAEALITFLAKRDRCAFFQAQAEKASGPTGYELAGLDTGSMYKSMFEIMDHALRQRPKLACIMAAEARCIQAVRRGDMNNSAIVTASKM